jgi:hypothetical protein
MWFRGVLSLLLAGAAAASGPADWVPARWNGTDPQSLDVLRDTPVNCLLLKSWEAAFLARAMERGLAALAVIAPGGDPVEQARRAVRDRLAGVVLEGDFPAGTSARVRAALTGSPAVVIELTARNRMRLGNSDPVVGTWQGVWPGIRVTEGGAVHAGPTGSPWIDTNTGFLRAVRAWGRSAIWLGNLPPEKTIVTAERYQQAIADAAMAGGRWIVALDADFAERLGRREAASLRDWGRMMALLRFFERHPEWRAYQPWGKLAVVQDPEAGALLSGGILDMIASRHTPVRPVPGSRLTPESLAGASMAVNVDADTLSPDRRDVLRQFARSGGTLLTPPGGRTGLPPGDRITLDKDETNRLNDLYHDVQSMIGRQNLGARLFNVSTMLSNLLASPDGKQLLLHLVNYSSYPVENVTVQLAGKFTHARLFLPDGTEKDLEVYPVEEGSGIDIDRVPVCATLRID